MIKYFLKWSTYCFYPLRKSMFYTCGNQSWCDIHFTPFWLFCFVFKASMSINVYSKHLGSFFFLFSFFFYFQFYKLSAEIEIDLRLHITSGYRDGSRVIRNLIAKNLLKCFCWSPKYYKVNHHENTVLRNKLKPCFLMSSSLTKFSLFC